jgi:uncharacterized protein YjbI with pentapeptide repeats
MLLAPPAWLRTSFAMMLDGLRLAGIGASFIAATFAYKAFQQRDTEYESEGFNRNQGQNALAWRTIQEANGKNYEIGQSASVLYLLEHNLAHGYINLNNSVLAFYDPSGYDPTVPAGNKKSVSEYLPLEHSSLCRSHIYSQGYKLNLSYSFLLNSTIEEGNLRFASFIGSIMDHATFKNDEAVHSNFMAAKLDYAIMEGGIFRNSNFTGASLRNVVTKRGSIGLNSPPDGGYVDIGRYEKDTDPWDDTFSKSKSVDEALISYGLEDDPKRNNFIVDFSEATFVATDLRGARLDNSNITQAQVDQACTDGTTVLPAELSARRACTIDSDVDAKRAKFEAATYANGATLCAAGVQKDFIPDYTDTNIPDYTNTSGKKMRR